MATPRRTDRENWPKNMYEPRPGYFVYRSPMSGRTISIGRHSVNEAIEVVNYFNKQAEEITEGDDMQRLARANSVVDRRGLLDASFITKKAMVFDSICGVYFLLKDDTIVYVGKSIAIMTRMCRHASEQRKDFNRVFVLECPQASMDRLERLYIEKFKPIYNASTPPIGEDATAWRTTVRDLLGDSIHSI